MLQNIKKITKYVLTFPQVALHKLKGVDHSYSELVDFFRYFPFSSINNDNSVNIRFHGKKLKFFYGPQGPVTAGEFASFDYEFLNVKDKVVIDVGAAIGDTAIIFKLKGAKKVFAFDINKRYLEIAKKNIEVNGLCEDIEFILSSVAGKEINKDDEILGAIMLDKDRESLNVIKNISLEEIIRKYKLRDPILKIDVDGYEYEILETSSANTLNKFDSICLEYHYGLKKIPQILQNAGFEYSVIPINQVDIDYHPDKYKNMDIGIINAKRVTKFA